MALVAVGREVKHSESYVQNRVHQWGSGWSDDERRKFKRWEADLRAVRWTVVEHIKDAMGNPAYALTRTMEDGTILTSQSMPHLWEEACTQCVNSKGMGPSHDPSPNCESGKRPHCSCDTCF